tara:strand:+ start:2642 stop:2908 length:267 start_codon:yes stop_codon:yes gene_type:complete
MDPDYWPTFQFNSTEHGVVNWKYADKEKQWHQTWIVKKRDIVILGKWSMSQKRAIRNELMLDIEKDNQVVRDRNNEKARKRRARRKLC